MRAILFDSYPILVWIQGEKGKDRVVSILEEAKRGQIRVSICQINLGEVYYKVIRAKDIFHAKIFLSSFKLLPVDIVPITEELVWKASEIKAQFSISYADCFAVASALSLNTTILTGDPEFKKVEEIVKIEWL